MPLSEKVRIEIYLPDLPHPAYQEFLESLEREFTYTFGVCTIARGLNGSYQSLIGLPIPDRVNLLYTDTPFDFDAGFAGLSRYTDALRQTAFEALDEEVVLVATFKVFHSG